MLVGLVSRCAENRAALGQDAAAPLNAQRFPAVLEHTSPRILEPDQLTQTVHVRRADGRADDRVESWAVAASGEDAYTHGGLLWLGH
jgi:hypothetical protein